MKTKVNLKTNVKKVASTVAITLVTLAAFANTNEANAQGFFQRLFGVRCSSCNCRQSYQAVQARSCARFGFSQYSICSPCSACQTTAQPAACAPCEKTDEPTCANGTCLTDPIEREYVPTEPTEAAPEPCEAVEEDAELSELEKELVREAIRVRGAACLRLKFDAIVNRRSQYNTQCQASYCRLGHYSGDSNEIAGVGYGSARAAIQGWLNSPAHRAILMRPNFTKVGACVKRGRDGLLYWTMNFGY